MDEEALKKLKKDSLEYHSGIAHGKYEVFPSKRMNGQEDLSLAYSPGVAYPCLEIQADPEISFELTNRANTVGIFTNGTAVLGLGDIGVLAAKPAMEGIVVLMKHLGDVDSLDVGVDTKDPDEFVNWVKLLEPSFGAFNLQDIKGPEWFYIEEKLQEVMKIPVMHNEWIGNLNICSIWKQLPKRSSFAFHLLSSCFQSLWDLDDCPLSFCPHTQIQLEDMTLLPAMAASFTGFSYPAFLWITTDLD